MLHGRNLNLAIMPPVVLVNMVPNPRLLKHLMALFPAPITAARPRNPLPPTDLRLVGKFFRLISDTIVLPPRSVHVTNPHVVLVPPDEERTVRESLLSLEILRLLVDYVGTRVTCYPLVFLDVRPRNTLGVYVVATMLVNLLELMVWH